MRKILREDGVAGIWAPGLVATWIRAMINTGLRIGLYPTAKRALQGASGSEESSFLLKASAGLLTGCCGAALANPTDVVRVRMQARPTSYLNPSIIIWGVCC